MTFGKKLKKLRNEKHLTQEQLAEKLFVTRTAISKWETENGYPGIDSLKAISALFQLPIDDLISDEDVENKKLLDEKIARRFYVAAMGCLAVTVLCTLLAYFAKLPYLNIGSLGGVCAYVGFGLLSKPKYKRLRARKLILPYLCSRVVILAVVISVAVYTILTL